MSPYRSPTTASRGTAASSAARSSSLSCTSAAPTFSSVGDPLSAGDGYDVVALGEHPRERELARRAARGLGELAHLRDEPQVGVERLALEARGTTGRPRVAGLQGLDGDGAGEDASPQWGVGDQADP